VGGRGGGGGAVDVKRVKGEFFSPLFNTVSSAAPQIPL
jgi:hypothetical protein